MDGSALRTGGQAYLGLVREQNDVSEDGHRTHHLLLREGIRGRQRVPAVVGSGRQLILQRTAGHDFLVSEEIPPDRLAIERHIRHISPFRMVGLDGEDAAVSKFHRDFLEERGRQLELSGTGAHGIQAQGAQDIPGTHLAAVFIAADAVRCGGVEPGKDLPDHFLRTGRRSHIIKQPGHVVAGFIAVGILADDASDARIHRFLPFRLVGKEGIQCGVQRLAAAHHGLKAGHVVRDEEAVVPGGCLREIAAALKRLQRLHPVSVGLLAAEETGVGVEEGAVAKGTLVILRRDIGMAQGLRHAGDAPVIVAEFQRLGHGFHLHVGRNVAEGVVQFRGVGVVHVGRNNHGLQGLLAIKTADAAKPGVGND